MALFDELHAAAVAARAKAHAPYSNFHVGAAIADETGRVHAGCNIENAAYPEGWCAETSAIAHMIMAGGRTITAVAVVAPRIPGGRFCTPCGGCRQRLAEFAGPDTTVTVFAPDGAHASFTMASLLPEGFSLEGRE
ncbi:cytidine deaminase [Methylobrevis albus]|uniref:cytidine deaminase n=1 Tax=Methylobrevis albus TaxID=2793297 RepID=UPI002E28E0B9|nr:cytidine deaminase [Methylobrevis albus]